MTGSELTRYRILPLIRAQEEEEEEEEEREKKRRMGGREERRCSEDSALQNCHLTVLLPDAHVAHPSITPSHAVSVFLENS